MFPRLREHRGPPQGVSRSQGRAPSAGSLLFLQPQILSLGRVCSVMHGPEWGESPRPLVHRGSPVPRLLSAEDPPMPIPGAVAAVSHGPTDVPHVRPSAPTRAPQCLTHKQARRLLPPHVLCPVSWSLRGSWFCTPGWVWTPDARTLGPLRRLHTPASPSCSLNPVSTCGVHAPHSHTGLGCVSPWRLLWPVPISGGQGPQR